MQVTRADAVTFEHREFLLNHGDHHITTASFEYFAANTPTDVLLEAREFGLGECTWHKIGIDCGQHGKVSGQLIGVSFASADGERSITVVHRDHRGKGVATALMLAKRDLVPSLKSHVAVINTASMRLSAKVYGNRGQVQTDGRVLFQREEKPQ